MTRLDVRIVRTASLCVSYCPKLADFAPLLEHLGRLNRISNGRGSYLKSGEVQLAVIFKKLFHFQIGVEKREVKFNN